MENAEVEEALLLQFAREPVPGRVKTRMQPVLSAQEACQLHCELVLWTSQRLTASGLGRVELAVAGSVDDPLFQQCQREGVAAVQAQVGEDLGQRMHNALQSGLQRFAKVVLVGSDCPELDRDYLAQALAALDHAEVVLGRAADGGYVLIAVRALDARWFEGISWGTDSVYAETITRFKASKSRWQALPALRDIDRPEDLPLWRERSLSN